MLGLACAVRPTFPRGIRRFGVAPQSVFRKLSRRAKLLGAELKDWSHEREQLLRIWTKKHLKTLQYLKTLPPDRLLELSRLKLVAANQQFDDRFNAAFFRSQETLQKTRASILLRKARKNGFLRKPLLGYLERVFSCLPMQSPFFEDKREHVPPSTMWEWCAPFARDTQRPVWWSHIRCDTMFM